MKEKFNRSIEGAAKETLSYKLGELSKAWDELVEALSDAIGITRFVNWLVKINSKQ